VTRYRSTFGELIRSRRESAALTQESLAQLSGLSRTFVSELERDLASPSLDVLIRLANGLGTSLSDLFSSWELDD